jgi:hypothetical protein
MQENFTVRKEVAKEELSTFGPLLFLPQQPELVYNQFHDLPNYLHRNKHIVIQINNLQHP